MSSNEKSTFSISGNDIEVTTNPPSEGITVYSIFDHQLTEILNLSSSKAYGALLTSVGFIAGALPNFLLSIHMARTGHLALSISDLAYLLLFPCALTVAVICFFAHFTGNTQKKYIEKIRSHGDINESEDNNSWHESILWYRTMERLGMPNTHLNKFYKNFSINNKKDDKKK